MPLHPEDSISASDLAAGQRHLVVDAAWGSLAGSLAGGVVLVAFAVSLGAPPVVLGLLAALPFLTQIAQLPTIQLVERLRQRKRIAVVAITAARVSMLGMAAVVLLPEAWRLPALLVVYTLVATLGAVGGCAVNSWFHQLIPKTELGNFFSRRIFWSTVLACVGTLAVGQLVDHWPGEDKLVAYALVFVVASLAGLTSSHYLARAPEPQMQDAGPPASVWSRLKVPLQDKNFRHLLVFLASWQVASNLAAPFIAVYLIRQLGYGLGTVTALWALSQVANALTLYLWGRLSDRLSNKAILIVALPVYFACTLLLVVSDNIAHPTARLALLAGLHLTMGAAGGGIALATGNLGLKLAPHGHATSYLAAVGLVSALGGGIAPLAAGVIAQGFESRTLSILWRWTSPKGEIEIAVFAFRHWEFVFLLSALLGLYVLHALSRVVEGKEVSERLVIQEFALEAMRSLNQLSSVSGLIGGLFTFERLSERRRFWRPPAKGNSQL